MLKRHPLYYLRHADQYAKRLLLPLLSPHKPDFLIIGAQKAATTSLYNYLNQLPGFAGSSNKEIYYFDREINHGKDTVWYHSFFKSISSRKKMFFEATPNYLYYPWVAKNIYDYNPDLKLIVVLRDPIARAFSAWNMYKKFFERKELFRLHKGLRPDEKNYISEYLFTNRDVFPSFEECIDIELKLIQNNPTIPEPSLLRRGLYSQQLKEFYHYFKSEQIYCIGYSDLIKEPHLMMNELYAWLKDAHHSIINFKAEGRNSGSYANSISNETLQNLNYFYDGEYERLVAMIGKPLNW